MAVPISRGSRSTDSAATADAAAAKRYGAGSPTICSAPPSAGPTMPAVCQVEELSAIAGASEIGGTAAATAG